METKMSLKQQIATIRSIADYTSLGVADGKYLNIRAFEFLNLYVLTIPTKFSVLSKDIDNYYLDEGLLLSSVSGNVSVGQFLDELNEYTNDVSSYYRMNFSYECYDVDGHCLYTAKMYAGGVCHVNYYNGRFIRIIEHGKLAATLYALADLVEK